VTGQVADTGFVVALHIGSWSMRLVLGRRTRGESRKQQRLREQREAEAERARWAEINLLVAAQTILRRAHDDLPTRRWKTGGTVTPLVSSR
jgi:hypothetical protein